MDFLNGESTDTPRIKTLKVQNFRALRSVHFTDLTPLTVLLGPNGSGKSTVLDALDFLIDCFHSGLRNAWQLRGGAKEIKTRGESGPVVIELRYREQPRLPVMAYHLAVDEERGRPVVQSEWLRCRPAARGENFSFLDYRRGEGSVAGDYRFDDGAGPKALSLRAPDLLAANVFGQLAEYPRIAALRNFIADWHISDLSTEEVREPSRSDRQLSESGDNLAGVVQYLAEQHPDRLDAIFRRLRQAVPQIEAARAEPEPGGRFQLQIKDDAFEDLIPAVFAADGTLKMLAYLVLLYAPEPPPFIGLEEPENFLHHRLLYELAETFRAATAHTQLLATTHSPFFLDALRPEEARILWRDKRGYTQTRRVANLWGVPEFMAEGALLGQLWSEGHFRVGDPLYNREAEPWSPRRGR